MKLEKTFSSPGKGLEFIKGPGKIFRYALFLAIDFVNQKCITLYEICNISSFSPNGLRDCVLLYTGHDKNNRSTNSQRAAA